MPRFSPAAVHTHLQRIERLAHDLAHDMEKSGAAPSQAARDVADCLKAHIDLVIGGLSRHATAPAKRQRPFGVSRRRSGFS